MGYHLRVMAKHAPVSIFALETDAQRAQHARADQVLEEYSPDEVEEAYGKLVAKRASHAGDAGEDAQAKAAKGRHAITAAPQDGQGPAEGLSPDGEAASQGAEPVSEPTGEPNRGSKDEPARETPATPAGGGKAEVSALQRRRQRQTYALAGVAVLLLLALGFTAGWNIGSDNAIVAQEGAVSAEEQLAADGESEAVQDEGSEAAADDEGPSDQELREANVAARHEALGLDLSEMDLVSPEDIEPITVDAVAVEPTNELARIADVDVSAGTGIQLDVPVVNQLDTSDGGEYLMAGCEVASLAMILRYAGVDVTKEELWQAMPTVPMNDEEGYYGNPNWAFVGDMHGDYHAAGYSVYHAPVAALAQSYLLNHSFQAVDLSGQSFTVMLKELASGNPCWVITTTSMTPTMWEEVWNTREGEMRINWDLHSVVVTGYDDDHIYINDPYGYEQNVAYDRNQFEQAWKLMGSQCVTIVPTR